jgi:redox-sensitive bicupin YhaK (pirin superfamily)
MTSQQRNVVKVIQPQSVLEGAGVRLRRSIATRILDHVDPFLLFDHFGSKNPADYIKGFPMHPHRGIETVTYMIDGQVDHKDSIGNAGTIGAGDVQWMTSGSGIMHEEMPRVHDREMIGFQLWVNLPARLKMMAPRYQNIDADQIPSINRDDGVNIRVIAGEVDHVRGPVTDIVADPTYLDIAIPPGASFSHPVKQRHAVFAYLFEGEASFGVNAENAGNPNIISEPKLVVFGDGDYISVSTANQPVRFLLISGAPLNEPMARYGPFVMNTQAEIEQALVDLKNGTFVKS